MPVQKDDLIKWETDSPDLVVEDTVLNLAINNFERELNVTLTEEYKDYVRLVKDQACGPVDGLDNFLVRYDGKTRKAVMAILFPLEQVISSTQLLQESIYDHRTLLPTGLIAIGSNYDDDGDAYIIYDVRPESSTYCHVFHWRYYVDNLIVGDGLGLLGVSFKAFLHVPSAEDEI